MFTCTTLIGKVRDQSTRLTRGASFDYGFDPMIYVFHRSTAPTDEQLQLLFGRYAELIQDVDDVAAQQLLHTALLEKTLGQLLGDGFEWMRFGSPWIVVFFFIW